MLLTASERLLAGLQAAGAYLVGLGFGALMLNLAISAGIVVLAVLAASLARRLLRHGARRIPGPANAEKTVRLSRATRFAWAVSRIVIGICALFAVAAAWGLDLVALLRAMFGPDAVRTAGRLAVLTVAAVIAFEVSGLLINNAIGRMAAHATARRRAAQLRTLGPLLRGVVQTAIVVILVLTVLGEIGVKIGPLLAGAGVVGIALGFGAQTLVKDFLTGLFLIVEDIVSVGDVIRIGDSGGLVEAMTLRTIRLRDFDGALHVFPYGEAQVVHNLTKTFSYYVFDLQISYESDIDRALAVMRRTGEELQKDPKLGPKILEPIEVVGVDSLGDRGVSLKARIKTLPIEQWNVGREYNRRIKLAFDREGIVIPYPHMKIVLPEQQIAAMAGA